jgi:Family of unknown function (DUF6763)
MSRTFPAIGQWFRRPNGALFEVVALDEEENTVEVQHFDGTIDEIELDAWPEQFLVAVAAPEDWSGSLDMDPEDFVGESADDMPRGFHDPLEFLDKDA